VETGDVLRRFVTDKSFNWLAQWAKAEAANHRGDQAGQLLGPVGIHIAVENA